MTPQGQETLFKDPGLQDDKTPYHPKLDHRTTRDTSKTKMSELQPSGKVLLLEILVSLLGALLWWIRKSDLSILGHEVELVYGRVPAECILWILVFYRRALQDMKRSILA